MLGRGKIGILTQKKCSRKPGDLPNTYIYIDLFRGVNKSIYKINYLCRIKTVSALCLNKIDKGLFYFKCFLKVLYKMKKIVFLFLFLFLPQMIFTKLSIELDNGLVLPVNYLKNFYSVNFNTALNFKLKTDIKFINLETSTKYIQLSNNITSLYLLPVLIYLNFQTPQFYKFSIFLFSGSGIIFEFLNINNDITKNYDPVISGGLGIEYSNIFKKIGVVLKTEYTFIYQKSQKDATHNGELITINFGILYEIF